MRHQRLLRQFLVDRVLQAAWNRAVVLGRDEKDCLDGSDGILERPRGRWKVRVVVIAVERQILEGDLRHLQFRRRQPHQRLCEFPIDRFFGKTADQITDLRSEEHTYELKSIMRISYAVFCLNKKTT